MNKQGEAVRVELQERDIRLLSLCYDHNFITLDHFDFEFGWKNPTEARKRALKLVKAGYLLREPSPLPQYRWYFRLTRKGQKTAVDWATVKSLPKHVNLNQFWHDALVALARQRLSQLWNVWFEPDRLLKERASESIWSQKTIVPDGIFTFRYSDGKIALEVENSDKGKTRFMEQIRRWSRSDGFYLVLYVASTPELAEILKRYILNCEGLEQKIAVVTWEALKGFAPMAWGPPDRQLSIFQTKDPIPCKWGPL